MYLAGQCVQLDRIYYFKRVSWTMKSRKLRTFTDQYLRLGYTASTRLIVQNEVLDRTIHVKKLSDIARLSPAVQCRNEVQPVAQEECSPLSVSGLAARSWGATNRILFV